MSKDYELLDDLVPLDDQGPLPASLAHLLDSLLADEPPLDPVAEIAAELAADPSASAFVRIEPAAGAAAPAGVPFRVVSSEPFKSGSFWGAGQVVQLQGGATSVELSWPRPGGRAQTARSFDIVAAVKDEIVFRFAYRYAKAKK